MTLEELDKLTSPQLAQEAEDKRNRSNFRPPFTKLTCDIAAVEGPFKPMLNNGQEAFGQAVNLKLVNIHSVEGVTPFTGTDYDLEVRVPNSANINSEATLMVISAQMLKPEINGISKLIGLKGVRLEERVHHFTGNRFVPSDSGAETDRDGRKGAWNREFPYETRYYHIVSIGGAANGAKAAVSEDRLSEALSVVPGMTHADALEYLGADGPDVLSKLVLGKKIKRGEDGVYAAV